MTIKSSLPHLGRKQLSWIFLKFLLVQYPCSIAEYSEILGPQFCTVRCILYNLRQGSFFRGTQRQWGDKCIENTFYKAIQSTFKSLEMLSKQRYKICISSVNLGQLKSVSEITKGFRIIFPKLQMPLNVLRTREFFLIPLSIVFFNPQSFKVSFFLRKIA